MIIKDSLNKVSKDTIFKIGVATSFVAGIIDGTTEIKKIENNSYNYPEYSISDIVEKCEEQDIQYDKINESIDKYDELSHSSSTGKDLELPVLEKAVIYVEKITDYIDSVFELRDKNNENLENLSIEKKENDNHSDNIEKYDSAVDSQKIEINESIKDGQAEVYDLEKDIKIDNISMEEIGEKRESIEGHDSIEVSFEIESTEENNTINIKNCEINEYKSIEEWKTLLYDQEEYINIDSESIEGSNEQVDFIEEKKSIELSSKIEGSEESSNLNIKTPEMNEYKSIEEWRTLLYDQEEYVNIEGENIDGPNEQVDFIEEKKSIELSSKIEGSEESSNLNIKTPEMNECKSIEEWRTLLYDQEEYVNIEGENIDGPNEQVDFIEEKKSIELSSKIEGSEESSNLNIKTSEMNEYKSIEEWRTLLYDQEEYVNIEGENIDGPNEQVDFIEEKKSIE